MNYQDVFYQVSSVCMAIVVAILGYVAYQITITLKSIRRILDDVEETTGDINALKNSLKGVFMSFGSIFGKIADKKVDGRSRKKR